MVNLRSFLPEALGNHPTNSAPRLPPSRAPPLQYLLHPLFRLPHPPPTQHPPHSIILLRIHLPLPLARLQALLITPHRPTVLPHPTAPGVSAVHIA